MEKGRPTETASRKFPNANPYPYRQPSCGLQRQTFGSFTTRVRHLPRHSVPSVLYGSAVLWYSSVLQYGIAPHRSGRSQACHSLPPSSATRRPRPCRSGCLLAGKARGTVPGRWPACAGYRSTAGRSSPWRSCHSRHAPPLSVKPSGSMSVGGRDSAEAVLRQCTRWSSAHCRLGRSLLVPATTLSTNAPHSSGKRTRGTPACRHGSIGGTLAWHSSSIVERLRDPTGWRGRDESAMGAHYRADLVGKMLPYAARRLRPFSICEHRAVKRFARAARRGALG